MSTKFNRISNNNLSILYVDDLEIHRRADGFNYMVFTIGVPEGEFEQARLMIDDEHLHLIMEYLCHEMDYFPLESDEVEDNDDDDTEDYDEEEEYDDD